MTFGTYTMGNQLGRYFGDLSCAMSTGMHVIGVHSELAADSAYAQFVNDFWKNIPTIIVNKNPASSLSDGLEKVRQKCTCERYCWRGEDPLMDHIPMVRNIMRQALHGYLNGERSNHTKLIHSQHEFKDSIDITTASNYTKYPRVADYAVHFRCSDNLFGGMGLLSFGTVIKHIPLNARFIYVFTEYGARLYNTPLAAVASDVLHALVRVIKNAAPNAVVVVTRGGDVLTVWAELFLAKVLLCSTSTFCLFPALGRGPEAPILMPENDYMMYNVRTHQPIPAANIGPNWTWLPSRDTYHRNFTAQTPASAIIETLMADVPAHLRPNRKLRRRL
jgi:hypothetical protein